MATDQAVKSGEELDGRIICLVGNLYRVPIHLIAYADSVPDVGSGKDIAFFNPRRLRMKGKVDKGKGFSREATAELRGAIRTEGLHRPLILRGWKDLGSRNLPILNGERRRRCIGKLIHDNVECWDASQHRWVPAKELYQTVECRIYLDIDEKTAYKYALAGNDEAEPIGEAATVHLIKIWRSKGWSDEDIMAVTGKSITWLRDTDSLAKLDDHTFDALCSGELNRAVAIKLADISDTTERLKRLQMARELAVQRIEALQKQIQEELAEPERTLRHHASACVSL